MSTSQRTILVTGASSGFGQMTVQELASRGHRVYAGMRDLGGRNADAAAKVPVGATAVEVDVSSDASVTTLAEELLADGAIPDVIVHNAGHMSYGPLESFTEAQLMQQYDVNVLGAHRLNRALLPAMRQRGSGHLVWVGSTSTRGGSPPFLGPYFAAKAGMDSLAVTYAAEVKLFGIETTIIVPGAFTTGTNHFAHAAMPADTARAASYGSAYGHILAVITDRLGALIPPDAEPYDVAVAIADAIESDRPPFRVHIDPSHDGAEVVNTVADRVRDEFLRRAQLDELVPTPPRH
jgi:NAD(P)-dependent dehydrogenase (short-subunit alcohol dehydrogenase family)